MFVSPGQALMITAWCLGAIILDSILHYNGTVNSQDVGREWARLVPQAVEDIKAGQSKGDFLALIHRNIDEEKILAETFNKFWNRNVQNKPFRLVDFNLKIPAEQVSQ